MSSDQPHPPAASNGGPEQGAFLSSRLVSVGDLARLEEAQRLGFTQAARKEVRWTTFTGNKHCIVSDWYAGEVPDPVYAKMISDAAELGWTPIKWWQIWRTDDTPNKFTTPSTTY